MTETPDESQPRRADGRPDYEQTGSAQGHYPPPHPPTPPAQPEAGSYPAYPQQAPQQGYGYPAAPPGSYPQGTPDYGYGYPAAPPGKGNETAGLVLGIIGLVNAVVISPFLWITGPVSLILGAFGVWQGKKAARGHANGTPGVVMGWINVALGILYVLALVAFIVLLGFAFSAGGAFDQTTF